MSGKGRDCLLRSRSVARRLNLNMPEHLKEPDSSAGGLNVTVAGSPLDEGLSEAVQISGQAEQTASFVGIVDAGFSAGDPAVSVPPEHGVVLSPSSSPAAERRPEVGEESSVSERLEIHRLQKTLQAGDELALQELKAYLGDWAVWLAPLDLPGEIYFNFKA